jgi:hypothetical protein
MRRHPLECAVIDPTDAQRIRQLEDQVIELTLINQELLQALALLIGNLEQVSAIGRQDAFHLSAAHLDHRLLGVLRESLGDDLQSEGLSFESDAERQE